MSSGLLDYTTSRSGSDVHHLTHSSTHTASPFFQTSTDSSSYEPQETTGSGNSGPRENGLFGANGSPPLILAFLAIGLFGIAMVVVFGFRRIHTGRWDSMRQLGAAGMGAPLLGEKPKLWDLWTKGSTMPQNGPRPWEHVTPFSVMMEPGDERTLSNGNIKSPPGTATPPNIPFTARARRRLHRLLRRRAPVTNTEPAALLPTTANPGPSPNSDAALLPTSVDNPQTGTSDATTADLPPNLGKARTLQVAVAILMPTPSHDATARRADEDEVLEYSIGTMTISWRRDADES